MHTGWMPACLNCLLAVGLAYSGHAQTIDAEFRRRAQQAEAQRQAQREAAEQAAADLMIAKLNTRMENVQFIETPLYDALRWWSGQTGISLVVDWDDAELQGADREAPVTMNVNNIIAGHALILMLDAATTPDLPDAQFIAEVHNRYVTLMTKGEANTRAYTVVYDAAEELLPTYDNFSTAPSLSLDQATQQQGGSGGSSSNSLFDNANNNRVDEREEQRIESAENLIEFLRTTIEPRLWEANGGTVARALHRSNRLIVRAPSYVHDQIPLMAIHTAARR